MPKLGWNCLLRATSQNTKFGWKPLPAPGGGYFQPCPKSIRTRSCPAPCLAPRKSCKPQGIPNPAQTPGTDTTPHVQLCPEHLPTSRLVLPQEKEFWKPWKLSMAIGAGCRSSLSSGSRQDLVLLDLPTEVGKKGKHPPKYLQEQLCNPAR